MASRQPLIRARRTRLSSRPLRRCRPLGVECLEPRHMLSVTLNTLSNITIPAGAAVPVVLSGTDSSNLALTFNASAGSSSPLKTQVTAATDPSIAINVTNYGTMDIQLYQDLVPNAVTPILSLVNAGKYDGLTFHRIISGFMIQGGDPNGNGTGGAGYQFDDQFNSLLRFTSSGVFALANSGADTNNSQFFITDSTYRSGDFRYTILGQLTSGDSVRSAINKVATDTSTNKPTTPVVMSSVTEFTDPTHRVMLLSAPVGTSGTYTVTYSAVDSSGATDTGSFQVTVAPDTDTYATAQPYLGAINPVSLTPGGTTTFNLPGVDVSNAGMYYDGTLQGSNSSAFTLTVDHNTGSTTLTVPANTAPGVYSFEADIRSANNARSYDTQMVPIFVDPAAPTGVTLTTHNANGAWDTSNNNAAAGSTLTFHVTGALSGAQVQVLSDGQVIGSATASASGGMDVTTNGSSTLAYGTHSITVAQSLVNQSVSVGNYAKEPWNTNPVNLASAATTAQTLTVQNSVVPVFTSSPGTPVVATGGSYSYQPTLQQDASGYVFSLAGAPTGISIDPNTGLISGTAPANVTKATYNLILTATSRTDAGTSGQQKYALQVVAPPAIQAIPTQGVVPGNTLTVTPSVTAQSTVTYSLDSSSNIPDATINASSGAVTIATTTGTALGTYTGTIVATDAAGLTGKASFSVVVENAPAFQSIADKVVAQGNTIRVTPYVTASSPVTYHLDSSSTLPGATIDPSTGVVTIATTASTAVGSYTGQIVASDQYGIAGNASFNLTVSAAGTKVDNAPTLQPIGDRKVQVGSPLSVQLQADDSDLPNDTLTYSLATGSQATAANGVQITPSGATTSATATLSWTPTQVGTYEEIVRVTDAAGNSAYQQFLVTVAPRTSDPPVFSTSNPTAKNVLPGGTLNVTLQATDPDTPASSIKYSILSGAPASSALAIDASSGVLQWSVPQNFAPGTFTLTVQAAKTVSGGTTVTAQTTLAVTVVGTPQFDAADPTHVSQVQGKALSAALHASDPNAPASAITYRILSGAPPLSGMAIDAQGTLTWTVPQGFLPATFPVTVEAAKSVADVGTVTVQTTLYITVTAASATGGGSTGGGSTGGGSTGGGSTGGGSTGGGATSGGQGGTITYVNAANTVEAAIYANRAVQTTVAAAAPGSPSTVVTTADASGRAAAATPGTGATGTGATGPAYVLGISAIFENYLDTLDMPGDRPPVETEEPAPEQLPNAGNEDLSSDPHAAAPEEKSAPAPQESSAVAVLVDAALRAMGTAEDPYLLSAG